MKVTKHASERLRERKGVKRENVEKTAQKALDEGITHKETRGQLNRYLTSLFFRNKNANNIRILGNNVYLFNGGTLITVIPLPQKFEPICAKIRRGKEKEI